MNDREQRRAFATELDSLVNRFANEWDLSNAAAVGVLSMKIQCLNQSIIDQQKHKDDE